MIFFMMFLSSFFSLSLFSMDLKEIDSELSVIEIEDNAEILPYLQSLNKHYYIVGCNFGGMLRLKRDPNKPNRIKLYKKNNNNPYFLEVENLLNENTLPEEDSERLIFVLSELKKHFNINSYQYSFLDGLNNEEVLEKSQFYFMNLDSFLDRLLFRKNNTCEKRDGYFIYTEKSEIPGNYPNFTNIGQVWIPENKKKSPCGFFRITLYNHKNNENENEKENEKKSFVYIAMAYVNEEDRNQNISIDFAEKLWKDIKEKYPHMGRIFFDTKHKRLVESAKKFADKYNLNIVIKKKTEGCFNIQVTI